MKSFLKKTLFLWIILFSNFLYADLFAYKHIFLSDASGVYESNGPLTFAISIDDEPSSIVGTGSLTVHYKTITSSSATEGEDYTVTEGDVTFVEGGATTLTFSVPILNDDTYESTEYVYVQISEDSLVYEINNDDDIGSGTIYDDDTLPLEIYVNNSSVTESDGTNYAAFYVSLNQPAPEGGVKITYSTSDDTASSLEDYDLTIDYITITEGSRGGYIYIPITGDTIPEETEQFLLDLSTCEGSINPQAIGTIYDDDAIKVYVSCDDIDEGNEGESNNLPCRIYLDKEYPLETDLSISYQSEDGAEPSARLDDDYRETSGSVTFTQGDIEKFVYIPTIGDNNIEEDERVTLKISDSDYIVVDEDTAEILNDDGSHPTLSFDSSDFSIIEGNDSISILNFTFTLDKIAESGSSFDYYTEEGTAEAGSDYEEVDIETYFIPEGASTVTLPINIYGDTDIEEDEKFYLHITNENNLVVSGHVATGNILNDDGSYPKISFSTTSISQNEGNSTYDINITLVLDKPAFGDCSFSYATAKGSANSAEGDYVAIPTSSYTIAEGDSSVTIPVTIQGDTIIENDEIFYFNIDNLNNLTLEGEDQASITLLNDDGSYPTISIESNNYNIVEGNSSITELEIKLILDAPALKDSNISYSTSDNTATDGSVSTEDNDYVQSSETISIPEGEESVTLTLSIIGDSNIEPDEDFQFSIHDPQNLLLGQESTSITIINDDEHDEEAFECDEHMYLSSSKKRGSEETGRMWLHRIDTQSSPFKFEVIDDEGEERLYNAIAYNPEDNYIYGMYHRELLKISRTGKVMSQGLVDTLPEALEDYQLFAGAIYDTEHYYVAGLGIDTNIIYTINLSDKSVKELILSESINIKDFSSSPKGDYLYGIIDGGKFTKINTATGLVTKIGEAHLGEFDSSFSDTNERFFANDSEGSGFYEFDITTGEKSFLSDSQPATYNDGANCLDAELVFTDYGDAPHDAGKYYGEAWHNIIGGIYLGTQVDHDPQSYDNEDASGDDTNGTDDEDGLVLADGTPLEGAYLEDNQTHQLKVTLSKEAYLRIWIDLNLDGYFDNGHDLVYDDKLTAGDHIIDINLPEGLTPNQRSYLRARVSSVPAMDYQGYLKDGEVEDYAIWFGSAIQPLRGVFNIERTNSANYPINSDDRNAWYTQIVGRDFDYSVLFYEEDMSQEKELDNVTVKLEIVDQDNNNSVLYQRYAHIKNDPPKSRIDITLPEDDLASLPATQKAIFRISYGVDGDGAIIQADCETDPEICYENNSLTRTDYAFDNFSIRPETFYLSLSDGEQERINSRMPIHSLSLASGYEYNLSMVATQYGSISPSNGYNKSLNGTFDFNSTGLTACADTSSITESINFQEGLHHNPNFSHYNVGRYLLSIEEDENWTDIDHNNGDCLLGDSSTSSDGNSKSGCNIKLETNPIELIFFPDHFKVDLNLNNLPDSNHSDFIYMSELNSTYHRMAIGFQGQISAQNEDNLTTSNFTTGCMATPILVDLNITTRSEEGINKIIHTVEGTNVAFSRLIRYNNDPDINHLDYNGTLPYINQAFSISSDRFIDETNGTLTLDMRYNLNKNLEEPINPIQISFQGIELNATEATSLSHDTLNITAIPHIPQGNQKFVNNVKNFYFAQISPDLINYPTVNMHVSPLMQTPFNVDIYCSASNAYCEETNVTINSNWNSSERKQSHFYLSIHHHPNLDGNITELNPNPAIVTILPDPTPPGAIDITLPNGRHGPSTTEFNNCSSPSCIISIVADPAITFNPKSHYQVNCSDIDPSKWTGVGKRGNTIESQPELLPSGKMEW